jgi:hypothetical protein
MTRKRPRVRFCEASFLTLPKMPSIRLRRLKLWYQAPSVEQLLAVLQ